MCDGWTGMKASRHQGIKQKKAKRVIHRLRGLEQII